jgi:hypothetical protein
MLHCRCAFKANSGKLQGAEEIDYFMLSTIDMAKKILTD